MSKISVLDCTLRDGGYVNDWTFGQSCISDVCRLLGRSGVEIIELGFLRDEEYNPDRAVFNSMARLSEVIGPKRPGIKYAVMCEAVNPLPLAKISQQNEETVDIIRVIVWKNLLKECIEYCKGIVARGYQLCIQPNRVEQYNADEYKEIIEKYNALDPIVFCVVDSFGLLNQRQITEYIKIADGNLNTGIALGYHGHNNLLQAFGIAESFLDLGLDRDIVIDASLDGIGRGAGNLPLELLAKYLNESYGKTYDLPAMTILYDKYISKIKQKNFWGYSMGYYLTALYRCNPMYADYYERELRLPAHSIQKILCKVTEADRIIFSRQKAKKYYDLYAHDGESI